MIKKQPNCYAVVSASGGFYHKTLRRSRKAAIDAFTGYGVSAQWTLYKEMGYRTRQIKLEVMAKLVSYYRARSVAMRRTFKWQLLVTAPPQSLAK